MKLETVLIFGRTLWSQFFFQHILRRAFFERHVSIRGALKIQGPGKVHFAAGSIIDRDVWGEHPTVIVTHASEALVSIGRGTILRGALIGCTQKVDIGDHCIIDQAMIIDADFHHVDAAKRRDSGIGLQAPVTIGEGCYIGQGAILMKGTAIGPFVTVLPRTVLGGKTVPASSRIHGFPARLK